MQETSNNLVLVNNREKMMRQMMVESLLLRCRKNSTDIGMLLAAFQNLILYLDVKGHIQIYLICQIVKTKIL